MMRVERGAVLACGLALLAPPAFAADLPARKAAPVEYVRVCSEFGAGFFYIPGSDTCLKVGGRIRSEVLFNQAFSRNDSALTFEARGYLTLDSYTATEWGPLRATTRAYVTKSSGSSASTTLDWAYIQFAGITAGRLENSIFDFTPLGDFGFLLTTIAGRGAYHQSINALAYTARLGAGFTATVSLEDRTERQVGIGTYTPFSPGFAGFGTTSLTYGGQTLPDVVGRLDWTQDWGSAVLVGAMHQVRPGGPYAGSFNGLPAAQGFVVDTEYGYAVNAGLKIKMPMVAAGDLLMVSAIWAYGASNYAGWTAAGSVGSQTVFVADAMMVPGTLEMKLSKSYSLSAGYLHYWTPTVRQSVFAAYGGIDQFGPFDARAVTVGSNVIWSPVRAFNIGAEVYYSRYIDEPVSAYPYDPATNGFNRSGTSSDNWGGRIRFQRDF